MLTWFAQIIRSFFFAIDNSLYGFIETLYNLLIDISRTTILTQGDIADFAGRIQMLLGVFMLFKVSFSLITYIINPDDFSDKSKGFAKLGQNIIISLVLLVITPYIFGMAYEAQVMILEDNVIGNLLFGTGEDDSFLDTGGQNLAFSVMIPFFRPDTGLSELSSCYNLYEPGDYTKFNVACSAQLFDVVDGDFNDELDKRIINNYKTGVENRIYGFTFRQEAVTFMTNGNEHFVFNYKILLSSAAAIIVILVLITFCMDVGLRSVKLAFLQLISPIPIISYIDPKQGKDGMFKKWYTMCFSTYISLFVRLLAVYFGLYLINVVINKGFTDVLTAAPVTGFWINLFMIIGILMFVKQLPKILEGFGIKLDGGGKFTLNPFKKFENEAAGGKQILGTGAALGAGALAGAVNFGSRALDRNTWKNGFLRGAGRTLSSTVAGATSATFRGARKVRKGESAGKVFSQSYGEAMFSKLLREDNLRKAGLEDSGLRQRIRFGLGSLGADVARATGNLNYGQREYLEKDRIDKEIQNLQESNSKLKVAQENLRQAKFSALEKAQNIGNNIDSMLENDTEVKAAKSAWENAKARGDDDATIENLRQMYKAKKGQVLARENAKSGSYINNQVKLYNQLQHDMSAEQQKIFKQLNTDVQYVADNNGQFITVGNEHYEIQTDPAGYNYYVDKSGSRYYESDWSSVGATRCKVKSGVDIIGDNDTSVKNEKIAFETSKEYTDIETQIKANEQSIEAKKADPSYIAASNENSRYKLENASRFNNQVQQPGYKPAASSNVNPRGINVASNSMPIPPTGSGNPGGHP